MEELKKLKDKWDGMSFSMVYFIIKKILSRLRYDGY